MFRFAHSNYFYLLLLIPACTVLFVMFMIWRKKALQRFGDYPLVIRLIPDYSISRLIFKFILVMIGMDFLFWLSWILRVVQSLRKSSGKGSI